MEDEDQPNGEIIVSSPGQKRQRARQACEPCRLRKRKCDGAMPCDMCRQFEYKCYYEKHSKKRSKLVERNAQEEISSNLVRSEPAKADQADVEDVLKVRNMEANSGMAFTRSLGQRLDPSSGPKLFTFGWNLGNTTYQPTPTTPITQLLDEDQMYRFAQYYFENVHLLYGFLDRNWLLQQIDLRWARPGLCEVPDHLFANLAAVGSSFSDGLLSAVMPTVVDSAKKALDNTTTMQPPDLLDVQSWLLRALYLRLTDHPHAVHMAACTAMHLIEAIGLHQEANESALHPPPAEQAQDIEIRRRTFWVARMINTWVSFEYGRTRGTPRGITTQLPTPRDGDYTVDYLNLYSLSCCLDPEKSDSKWEDFLRQLDEYEAKHDAIELSRANLGLCGYRRIRLTNPNPSSEIINRIIKMGLRGLEAVGRLCEKRLPWWHVANVPFQAICVFLAMDVRESLVHISTAMRTLETVGETFQTTAVKEAVKTARFLVRLSKKRKEEDAEVLGHTLEKDGLEGDPQPENLRQPMLNDHAASYGDVPPSVDSDDWSYEALKNFPEFDWTLLLAADMPASNIFAPDGAM